MIKKVLVGFLILATSTLFGMSLSAVNKASKSDLMNINGIGEVKAAAIMKARPFKSFDDVESVTGVGKQLVANIKGDVKSAANVKKVSKTATKSKSKAKAKKDDVKAEKKSKKTKSKADTKETKKRKIKSVDDKKKELKTKAKKTKEKKTKAKKEKKKKTKTKK